MGSRDQRRRLGLAVAVRSGISIESYQLDPVVRALEMPRVSLGIFDDVGLGKTIEAGLVAQELLLRHRARSVWVVCPPILCLKCQAEGHRVARRSAESAVLNAFVAVLGARRLFAAASGERLEDLLAESAAAQTELTDTLGLQVRRAVELLVAATSTWRER